MRVLHPISLLLAGLANAVCAAGSDELWEVQLQVNDKTRGAIVATRAQPQCLPKGAEPGDIVPMRDGCRMVEQQAAGARVSFRFECAGKDRITGEGVIDRPTPDAYAGNLRMRGTTADGRAIDVLIDYSGRRTGECTFGAPAEGTTPAPSGQ